MQRNGGGQNGIVLQNLDTSNTYIMKKMGESED